MIYCWRCWPQLQAWITNWTNRWTNYHYNQSIVCWNGLKENSRWSWSVWKYNKSRSIAYGEIRKFHGQLCYAITFYYTLLGHAIAVTSMNAKTMGNQIQKKEKNDTIKCCENDIDWSVGQLLFYLKTEKCQRKGLNFDNFSSKKLENCWPKIQFTIFDL